MDAMRGRAAVLATTALLLAACTSGKGGPTPEASRSLARLESRSAAAVPVITQCAINDGNREIIAAAEKANAALPANQQWLHSDRIELTEANGVLFNAAYNGHIGGIRIGGMELDWWGEWAASADRLPPEVCGPGVSPKALYNQIYANYPARRQENPWDS